MDASTSSHPKKKRTPRIAEATSNEGGVLVGRSPTDNKNRIDRVKAEKSKTASVPSPSVRTSNPSTAEARKSKVATLPSPFVRIREPSITNSRTPEETTLPLSSAMTTREPSRQRKLKKKHRPSELGKGTSGTKVGATEEAAVSLSTQRKHESSKLKAGTSKSNKAKSRSSHSALPHKLIPIKKRPLMNTAHKPLCKKTDKSSSPLLIEKKKRRLILLPETSSDEEDSVVAPVPQKTIIIEGCNKDQRTRAWAEEVKKGVEDVPGITVKMNPEPREGCMEVCYEIVETLFSQAFLRKTDGTSRRNSAKDLDEYSSFGKVAQNDVLRSSNYRKS